MWGKNKEFFRLVNVYILQQFLSKENEMMFWQILMAKLRLSHLENWARPWKDKLLWCPRDARTVVVAVIRIMQGVGRGGVGGQNGLLPSGWWLGWTFYCGKKDPIIKKNVMTLSVHSLLPPPLSKHPLSLPFYFEAYSRAMSYSRVNISAGVSTTDSSFKHRLNVPIAPAKDGW
jgi:hypothetical protein